MKKSILFLISLFLFKSVFGQDSTKIIFTEEPDTLVKQRFIDRYDNVFMTKVPTRHMFKIGISQYYQPIQFSLSDDKILNNSSLMLGYEFKFLPAFSIALSSHLPVYSAEIPSRYIGYNFVYDAQLKWFFDMKNRIREGKSANNFSGNYIAVNYTLTGEPVDRKNDETIGIKVGFQRRVLNSGFLDFAFAFQQQDIGFSYGITKLWQFSTQISFGYAFGDWVSSKKRPLCDILLCEEEIANQWKIKVPELTFGYYLNRMRYGVAYEHMIKRTPFSLNWQYDLNLMQGYSYTKGSVYPTVLDTYGSVVTKEITQFFTLQPRYYFLQKRNQRRGRNTNSLSGFYAGINAEYAMHHGHHNTMSGQPDVNLAKYTIYSGLLLGIQQRLFQHGYLDFNTSFNHKHEFSSSVNSTGFRGNLGLGFAF
ncbi:hypothetical protein L0657_25950 [Dyadobacter sp. CY345]|uniref:hypothetical protein n=1 Tax=Dyadobacter sp. CY345 TaxID=2909335 RepID=UPI001F2C510E|nr:hypothetical protein [Dyadobacter sp. CY345]MCF2447424.1 hypothetical protein [Dyadobacter sp. CY345]